MTAKKDGLLEERKAIERLKRGDAGGLEVLLEAHYAKAVRTAYLVVRDRAMAEDVAQGAFILAYEKIDRFDGRRAFAPWFAKLVLNESAVAVRRRERHRGRTVSFPDGDELEALLADPGAGPPEEAEEAEDRRRVWSALEKLPPTQRAAVVQRYYLGMSEAEMAEDGVASAGTVKSRLYAARKKLARRLRPQFQREETPGPIAAPLPNDLGRSHDRG